MADGEDGLGKRNVLKGGRVIIKGKRYNSEFLCEWVGKTVKISTWVHEMCPNQILYRAQPLGEEIFIPLWESKLPQDRESGEVQAERDGAIDDVREILESAAKLLFPGYSVQIITSPVGTGRW